MPELHHGILSIILPDAAAERQRGDIYNTAHSLGGAGQARVSPETDNAVPQVLKY